MRLIELLVANSIDRKNPWRICVPLDVILSVEQNATINGGDQDVARLTLADRRVLWSTESYSALVERLRSRFDDRASPCDTTPWPTIG